MDIDDILAVNERTQKWLGQGIALVASALLDRKTLQEKLRFVEHLSAPLAEVLFAAIATSFNAPIDQDTFRLVHRFTTANSCSLSDVRTVKTPKPGTELEYLFRALSIPGSYAERDAWITCTYGQAYAALDAACAGTDIRNKDAAWCARQVTREKTPIERAKYAWCLATSKDELKNPLAMPMLVSTLVPAPDLAERHILLLYDSIDKLAGSTNKYDRRLMKLEEEKKGMSALVEELRSERDASRAEAETQRTSAAALQARLQGLESRAAENAELHGVQNALHQARDDLAVWEQLARNAEGERNAAQEALGEERRYSRLLEQRLKNAMATSAASLGNGTGISIFTTPEFRQRYIKELCDYRDDELNQGMFTFPDAIDMALRHLCQRIKDGGKSIILSDLEYMPKVQCYFFKKNDRPGKYTRIFFRSDFTQKLVVYDVTTPAEHAAKIQSDKGRYKAIMDGRVEFLEGELVPLNSSVRELGT
ncbi:hypothetical protein HY642_05005 [Candidatus Woesearchaeota archaeon]|nr:hypothetical protein [Candidatus Woesearchaeota archaeon]